MPPATTASSDESTGQFFLRWSESPGLPVREEPIEMIESEWPEPRIRSAFQVREGTEAFLIGNGYTENGIIRSCLREGNSFLLTLSISSECISTEFLPHYDPGLLAVDEFLTEEEETKILESLK